GLSQPPQGTARCGTAPDGGAAAGKLAASGATLPAPLGGAATPSPHEGSPGWDKAGRQPCTDTVVAPPRPWVSPERAAGLTVPAAAVGVLTVLVVSVVLLVEHWEDLVWKGVCGLFIGISAVLLAFFVAHLAGDWCDFRRGWWSTWPSPAARARAEARSRG
ncbi:unnamed protein product, partial [Prorocentrum cordatum]